MKVSYRICLYSVLNILLLCLSVYFLFACKAKHYEAVQVSENAYFVASNGNDKNSGTFEEPWASWQKAFLVAGAGDTVYIRGGVYYADNEDPYGVFVAGKNGRKKSPVCIFNYPDETPVLDCSKIKISSGKSGVFLLECTYFHLKGLVVTGVRQYSLSVGVKGFSFEKGGGHIIERCTSFGNEGSGFWGYKLDTISIIQCDSYDNFDVATEGYSGGQADGFVFTNFERGSYTYYNECRSWYNSDDGFDCWQNEGTVVFNNCWAFNNGRGDGDGGGFKLGETNEVPSSEAQRILINCMAFNNRFIGFNQNNGNVRMEFFNNIAYANDNIGFDIGQYDNVMVVKNNISYKNKWPAYYIPQNNDHNTWNSATGVSVEDADFVSLDSNGVSGKRLNDGHLPKLGFLRLANGSDLKQAGVDVGLPFDGNAPDLGPFFEK